MSDVPAVFTDEYYNIDYFKTPKGKKFLRADGTLDAWSYANPTGESEGCAPIVKAWTKMFHPKTMLDVGAGRGTLIAYARDVGIKAVGFDFSKWACSDEGRYGRCQREWLKVHDATKPWPYQDNSFDFVTALDLFEHIYTEDLQFVIQELYRVCNKWIFLQIATVGGGSIHKEGVQEDGYILKKGTPIPIEREGNAVAGHVTVCSPAFWEEQLEHEDWLIRRDMVTWFISLVDSNIIRNWLLNTMFVLEKIE